MLQNSNSNPANVGLSENVPSDKMQVPPTFTPDIVGMEDKRTPQVVAPLMEEADCTFRTSSQKTAC